jgi:cytochrome c oxidase subunit 2
VGPPPHPDLTIDVSAHQWWWEVHYDADDPQLQFSTANEIHIPVGAKVLVRLTGADVIHSFWVPQLSGKTDTIPGQTNLSWMEARVPGRYRGQCGEFCGFQHARMSLEVVAESASDFQRWRAHQLQPAAMPTTPQQQRGEALVEYRCGLCHAIRGSMAEARSAPDLTHLMSRRMIAAGTIVNSPANLAEWVQDPQSVKPGNLMPDQGLTAQQLADVQSYLELLN